ncbi:MAG: response regulator transcription factor [Candidatus Promineifilaceae bacterium]
MQAIVIAGDSEDRDFLSFVLRHSGLAVAQTAETQHGTSALRDYPVDLIVLVLNPRDASVPEIKEVRAITQAPIILLVERLTEGEHCALLDAGADIVLEKPVSSRILTRYTHMLLRRAGTVPASVLSIIVAGDLSLDPTSRHITQADHEPHRLSPLEFRLLFLLMTNRNQVIPIDTIVERVWGYSGDGNRELVRGLVRRLRRKIETDPAGRQYIENLPGIGYLFRSE